MDFEDPNMTKDHECTGPDCPECNSQQQESSECKACSDPDSMEEHTCGM